MLRTYNFPNVTLVRWYVGTFVRCFATSHFTLFPYPIIAQAVYSSALHEILVKIGAFFVPIFVSS